MHQVVVGVEESDGAGRALRWGVREAAVHGWTVAAVMAWGFLDQHHTVVGERFDPSYGEDDALETLNKIVESVLGDEAGAAVERRVVCDLPAKALLDASAGSELLVLGARGLGGFRGLLLGSVSQRCLHHATSPIAIVRHSAEFPNGGTPRIVVAVDGSETAQRALRWALEEGRLRHASVQVVHAWHPPYFVGYPDTLGTYDPWNGEDHSLRLLDRAIAAEKGDGLPLRVERISVLGSPARVVLDVAERAELVVMGSRGLGDFKGALLGSVTNQVVHHAPCPVVVLPPTSEGQRLAQ